MPPPADPAPGITKEMVRAELARILASSIFSNAKRLSRFLQFVVESASDGKSGELKEYAIGVEVFQRDQSFDPRIDTIVRVQAAKLRSKLMEYYNSGGRQDAVVISIPKGGYAPVFARSDAAQKHQVEQVRASVAVLPFLNLSPEPENEYFSDGLTEEIINALTGVAGLQVVARTSVFRFKGERRDVREIGALLNAGTILEGSVRKAASQLRITTQLINVSDGYHLWSHTFQRESRDLFAVQEEIARSVRDLLAPHFAGTPSRAKQYEPEPLAHDLYLKGHYAQARLLGGDVPRAIGFFEQSIAADPGYARAHSGLADAWFLLAYWGVVRPHDALPKARAAAQRALELDDWLAEAHASLGAIQCSYEWKWDEGRRSIERALELDLDSAIVNHTYVLQVLVPTLRIDEGIATLRKTVLLDPYMPFPQASLTYLLGIQQRLAEAEQQHAATIATNPHYFLSYSLMAQAYLMNERFADALEMAAAAYDASGRIPQTAGFLAAMHAKNGNKERARELLGEVLDARRQRYIRATDIAAIYCAVGDRDEAISWLHTALEERTVHLYLAPIDPRFRQLHSDPGFSAILDRIGLRRAGDYAPASGGNFSSSQSKTAQ
jgi:serine/threonine-protein kinase